MKPSKPVFVFSNNCLFLFPTYLAMKQNPFCCLQSLEFSGVPQKMTHSSRIDTCIGAHWHTRLTLQSEIDHGQDWWVFGHTLNTQLLLQLEIFFKRCMVECGKSQSYLKCQLLKSETFSSGQNRWHYPTELQTPVNTFVSQLPLTQHSDVRGLRCLVPQGSGIMGPAAVPTTLTGLDVLQLEYWSLIGQQFSIQSPLKLGRRTGLSWAGQSEVWPWSIQYI